MASHENLPYKIIGVCRCTATGTIKQSCENNSGNAAAVKESRAAESCKEQPLNTAQAEAPEAQHNPGQIQLQHKIMGCFSAQCLISASDVNPSLAIKWNTTFASKYTSEPIYTLGFILEWCLFKECNPS